MAIKYFTPQSSDWLKARQQYVTGTEVAGILGLDKYKSWKKIKQDKYVAAKPFDNQYMRAGRILEPGVLIALKEIGIPAEPAHATKVVFAYDDDLHLAASMDGKAKTDDGIFYVVECKTTSEEKFNAWFDNVPLNYFLQVQTQMMVSKAEHAIIACLCTQFPFPLVVYEIKPAKDIQDMIAEATKRFWAAVLSDGDYEYNQDYKLYIKENFQKYCELLSK